MIDFLVGLSGGIPPFFREFVPTSLAITAGAALATLGWWYIARQQRKLMRKQHTVRVVLDMSSNDTYLRALRTTRPYRHKREMPPLHSEAGVREDFNFLLNYYEGLAAAVRLGDIDEMLLFNLDAIAVKQLYECAAGTFDDIRARRERSGIYEHLDWLYRRWFVPRPRFIQRCIGAIRGRTIYGRRPSR